MRKYQTIQFFTPKGVSLFGLWSKASEARRVFVFVHGLFDYEMGLNVSRAKEFGVDITLKIIPREVFDKKAVEKGQVKFYDKDVTT